MQHKKDLLLQSHSCHYFVIFAIKLPYGHHHNCGVCPLFSHHNNQLLIESLVECKNVGGQGNQYGLFLTCSNQFLLIFFITQQIIFLGGSGRMHNWGKGREGGGTIFKCDFWLKSKFAGGGVICSFALPNQAGVLGVHQNIPKCSWNFNYRACLWKLDLCTRSSELF